MSEETLDIVAGGQAAVTKTLVNFLSIEPRICSYETIVDTALELKQAYRTLTIIIELDPTTQITRDIIAKLREKIQSPYRYEIYLTTDSILENDELEGLHQSIVMVVTPVHIMCGLDRFVPAFFAKIIPTPIHKSLIMIITSNGEVMHGISDILLSQNCILLPAFFEYEVFRYLAVYQPDLIVIDNRLPAHIHSNVKKHLYGSGNNILTDARLSELQLMSYDLHSAYFDTKGLQHFVGKVNEFLAERSHPYRTKKHIVIIDDEVGALTLETIMMTRGGFAVTKAKDALHALEILHRYRPDLIITDVMMPGMDGIELCRVMREIEHLSSLPILILSARGDANSLMRGMEAGANDYLPKPILHHDLVAKIRTMLRSGIDDDLTDNGHNFEKLRQAWVTLKSQYEGFRFESHDVSDQVYAQLTEATALTSHVLHDVTNAIGVISSHCRSLLKNATTEAIDQVQTIDLNVKDVSLLVADLSELRFTFRWQPRFIDLNQILGEAISIANFRRPRTTFSLLPALQTELNLFGDLNQVLQLLVDVMTLIADKSAPETTDVAITIDDKFINITWDGVTLLPELAGLQSTIMLEINPPILIVIHKLRQRHQAFFKQSRNSFSLSFPLNVMPPDTALAQETAQMEQEVEQLRKSVALRQSNLLTEDVIASELITEQANRIIRRLEQLRTAITAITSDEQIRSATKAMLRSVRFARLLIANLLTVTSGSHPKQEILNLQSLLDDAILLIDNRIPEDVEISVKVTGIPLIKADESSILQIFLNLLINALEAMGDEGKLFISSEVANGNVRVTITDSGKGIAPEQMGRMYELYYSTKKGQQRGVGLHVVKTIMDSLGGTIQVTSQVDNGTTFILNFLGAHDE